ncbi:hypothetical protein CTI12_AA456650 [Artemisia annua]|uniref:Uncharacterized protein n=1 Tax=Artemisia annua TaxID=35608 RepID=A0A2U1LTB4_ARTAN|nr:hypothetical protein CTI12_AA456650 [Artemisia annua]
MNRRYKGRNQFQEMRNNIGAGNNGDKGKKVENNNVVGQKKYVQYQKKDAGIQTVNKYGVLEEVEDESNEMEILKGRMTVDDFLNKKLKPNAIEITKWTPDMLKYFKEQEELDRIKEAEELNGNIEDVLEGTSGIAKGLSANEVSGRDTTVLH